MIDEIRALLTHHLRSYEVRSRADRPEKKEAGPDRRSESTRREANLLAAVNEVSPLPVPEPVFADVEASVLAYFKLPGVPCSIMRWPIPRGWRPTWASS